tara:strand:+ start:283 stop:1059 length:777 start_codon:yes stop_codon:yes gene_type:complete
MNNIFIDASYSQVNEEFLSYINNLSPMNNWLQQNTSPNTYPSIIDISFVDNWFDNDVSNNSISMDNTELGNMEHDDILFNDISFNNYSNFNFESIFRNTVQNRINEEVSSIQSMEEEPEYKLLLKEDAVSSFKNISYKDSQKTNECCPILMTSFEEDDDVIELGCKHCFDRDSIIYWLTKENAICPVCRFQLPEELIKKEVIHKKPLSRSQIENFVRSRYINQLTNSLNSVYENENEIAMQRILLDSYATPPDASNNS